MSTGKVILIGSLIGLPLLAAAYYKYILSNYDYSIAGVTPITIDGANSVIQVTINITSKIGISFTISDIYLDVYVEGVKVGNVQQVEGIVVPNYGNTQLVLNVNVDLTKLEGNIVSIVYGGLQGNGYNSTLVGYTHVKVGVMPFTTNVAIQEAFTLSI